MDNVVLNAAVQIQANFPPTKHASWGPLLEEYSQGFTEVKIPNGSWVTFWGIKSVDEPSIYRGL
jgi:hypothetical protein